MKRQIDLAKKAKPAPVPKPEAPAPVVVTRPAPPPPPSSRPAQLRKPPTVPEPVKSPESSGARLVTIILLIFILFVLGFGYYLYIVR